MTRSPRTLVVLVALVLALASGAAARAAATDAETPKRLPWAVAGWTERQAAAHLLDRFAFGPRPGDVDRVVGRVSRRGSRRSSAARSPTRGSRRRSDRSTPGRCRRATSCGRFRPTRAAPRRDARRADRSRRAVPPAPGDPPGKGKGSERRAAIVAALPRARLPTGARADRSAHGAQAAAGGLLARTSSRRCWSTSGSTTSTSRSPTIGLASICSPSSATPSRPACSASSTTWCPRWRRIRRCCSTSTTRSRPRTRAPTPPLDRRLEEADGGGMRGAGGTRHAARAADR